MRKLRLYCAAYAACLVAFGAHAQSASPAPAAIAETEDNRPRWLDALIFSPTHAFAPPPAGGSLVEKLEMDRVRTLVAAATPERLQQAQWDGEHEEPAAFAQAAARDFARLPATKALLHTISEEVERVVNAGKTHFRRPRPYQIDPQLPHCGKGSSTATGYPSGHAGYGWSVGWTLARLIPDRAPAIVARAEDFALSREICGVHMRADLEASHAAATAAVEQLLSDPRLADQVAAARVELARPSLQTFPKRRGKP